MSSVDISDFKRAGQAFKFNDIGDTVSGIITSIRPPEERTNQFTGADEMVMSITIQQPDGEEWSVWPRMSPGSFLGGAVSEAVDPYDGNIEIGGTMSVQYLEDRDTGKGRDAKVYVVEYKPATAKPKSVNIDPGDEPF